MPVDMKEREERPRRASRSKNTGFPVGPALGVVALVALAYFGSQLVAQGEVAPPPKKPAYVPFAAVPVEAPPDPSNRPGARWVNNAPEGLAGTSPAFAAARRLAAQGPPSAGEAQDQGHRETQRYATDRGGGGEDPVDTHQPGNDEPGAEAPQSGGGKAGNRTQNSEFGHKSAHQVAARGFLA